MSEKTTKPSDEIAAMQAVAKAMENLDEAAVGRVLQWACARFGVAAGRRGDEALALANTGLNGGPEFESLADLYAAADPGTDADRALVAGY